MGTRIKCELEYIASPHLTQLYDGFAKLEKAGKVKLIVKPSVSGNQFKPLLKVVVNQKYKLVYDALDGLNWIEGTTSDNLKYFNENTRADFYFKRSFNQQIIDNAPKGCVVFPLGLNYQISPEKDYSIHFKDKLKAFLYGNILTEKFYKKYKFKSEDFEHAPVPEKETRILFLTRLWNPADSKSKKTASEREIINQNRIDFIKSCKKEFGNRFTGGLTHDQFTVKYAKELILPQSFTKKENFLKAVKSHNICVASTGLHQSIGWKFGEYVAASRAIVSEPLHYVLPGEFVENKNYLTFDNTAQLLEKINDLLDNHSKMKEMMEQNANYYKHYVRPDVLVWNTLLKVIESGKD